MAQGGQLPDPAMLQRAADILNGAEKPFILAGRGSIGATRGAAGDRRAAPGADRQAAARQGSRCPTRAPIRPAASACSAPSRRRRRSKAATRLLIVGSSFPYIEFYPEARQSQVRPDRARPQARRPALSGRCRPDRRQQARAFRAAAAAAARTTAASSSSRRRRACGLARADDRARDPHRHADEAAGRHARAQQIARRRCDRDHRQRHHHLVDRAPRRYARRHDVQLLGNAREHGVRPALCDRRDDRLSRTGRSSR